MRFPDIDHRFDKVLAVQAKYPGNADNKELVQVLDYRQLALEFRLSVVIKRSIILVIRMPWALTLAIENVIRRDVHHLRVNSLCRLRNICGSLRIDLMYLFLINRIQ